jgi:hypothetical protein
MVGTIRVFGFKFNLVVFLQKKLVVGICDEMNFYIDGPNNTITVVRKINACGLG